MTLAKMIKNVYEKLNAKFDKHGGKVDGNVTITGTLNVENINCPNFSAGGKGLKVKSYDPETMTLELEDA
jgi:hypothetical protein